MITERQVAEALRDGLIPSPVQFFNGTFFLLRITACGAAWRGPPHDEFAWRDASIWLTPEMCARWQGAPVIVQHPDRGILDTKEYANRVVGAIVLAFVKGAELWAVARVIDGDVATLIAKGGADTSPAVVFPSDIATSKITLPDGATCFVEPPPQLCDHLALVTSGVWSKGGAASGIDTAATSNEGAPVA